MLSYEHVEELTLATREFCLPPRNSGENTKAKRQPQTREALRCAKNSRHSLSRDPTLQNQYPELLTPVSLETFSIPDNLLHLKNLHSQTHSTQAESPPTRTMAGAESAQYEPRRPTPFWRGNKPFFRRERLYHSRPDALRPSRFTRSACRASMFSLHPQDYS